MDDMGCLLFVPATSVLPTLSTMGLMVSDYENIDVQDYQSTYNYIETLSLEELQELRETISDQIIDNNEQLSEKTL